MGESGRGGEWWSRGVERSRPVTLEEGRGKGEPGRGVWWTGSLTGGRKIGETGLLGRCGESADG